MHCRLQSWGKGVGLQPLCAREEEWVPGDVILTGRGQLSQYSRLQEKRSLRKTENTKPSPAIFSLIWNKSIKISQFCFSCPLFSLYSLYFYNNNPGCPLTAPLHRVYWWETRETTLRGESRGAAKSQKTKSLAKYRSKCFRYWRSARWNLGQPYLYYSCYPKTQG